MPVVPVNGRKYEPKHLWQHYKEIARRVAAGQRNKDIARDLGMHPQSICVIKNSQIVKRRINELQEKADDRSTDVAKRTSGAEATIRELAVDCADKLKDMIESNELSEANKIKVLFGTLDRAGVGPVTRSQNSHLVGTLTNEELIGMLHRAETDGAVEATYEEVDEAV